MLKGTVILWKAKTGYGFIRPDGNSKDIFVHHSGILSTGKRKDLREEARVTFEVVEDARGPKAINVREEGENRA